MSAVVAYATFGVLLGSCLAAAALLLAVIVSAERDEFVADPGVCPEVRRNRRPSGRSAAAD